MRAEGEALPLLWQGRRWWTGPSQPDVSYIPIAAARSLAALEPEIPADARVLLVTPSPFVVAYDFYLAPRPLAVLMRVDAALLEKAAAVHPATARQAQRWIEQLEERGQSLTAEHLRERLRDADYVVTFLSDAAQLGLARPGLLPPGASLEPVARQEQAALYRVLRP